VRLKTTGGPRRGDSGGRIAGGPWIEPGGSPLSPLHPSYTSYALSKDGAGFVMVEVDPNAGPTQLNVVLNWAEGVKRKK